MPRIRHHLPIPPRLPTEWSVGEMFLGETELHPQHSTTLHPNHSMTPSYVGIALHVPAYAPCVLTSTSSHVAPSPVSHSGKRGQRRPGNQDTFVSTSRTVCRTASPHRTVHNSVSHRSHSSSHSSSHPSSAPSSPPSPYFTSHGQTAYLDSPTPAHVASPRRLPLVYHRNDNARTDPASISSPARWGEGRVLRKSSRIEPGGAKAGQRGLGMCG